MALNPFDWSPKTGVNDTNAFPSSDKLFRVHLQALLDQVKTYFNNDIKNEIDSKAYKTLDFVSSNQLNGYQKIPSGLIIQWGSNYVYSTGTDITLPIAFPNYCATVLCSVNDVNNSACSVISKSNTTIKLKQFWTGGNLPVNWIAIGY